MGNHITELLYNKAAQSAKTNSDTTGFYKFWIKGDKRNKEFKYCMRKEFIDTFQNLVIDEFLASVDLPDVELKSQIRENVYKHFGISKGEP